jgi:hypothetical protein
MDKRSRLSRFPCRAAAWAAVAVASAVTSVLAAAGAASAQDLPMVSRQLQFHAAPGQAGIGQDGTGQPAVGPVNVPVDLSNVPNRPLPPAARILPQQVNPATGRYLPGVQGERGVVLPEKVAQLPSGAMPPLVRGQTYIPPWWDKVRNVSGGSGPADPGPVDRGVQPEDLQLSPPAPRGEDLPEAAPSSPVQGGAAPAAQPSRAAAQSGQPTISRSRTSQPFVRQPSVAQPAVRQPAAPQAPKAPTAGATSSAGSQAEAQRAPAQDGLVPLVSRRLNFQY